LREVAPVTTAIDVKDSFLKNYLTGNIKSETGYILALINLKTIYPHLRLYHFITIGKCVKKKFQISLL